MADWENFAKAVLTDWPTGDLDGSVLFDLSLQYGMIKEVPGGYNSNHHIDAEGICPEEGDHWYEYTFGGEAGPGLYSITDMTRRIEELEGELAKAVEALERQAEAWSNALELNIIAPQHRTAASILRDEARTTLAELKGQADG